MRTPRERTVLSESDPTTPPDHGLPPTDRFPVAELQLRTPLPATVDQRELLDWVERLVWELSPASTSLTILIADSSEVRSLNRRFRDQHKATDILSFPGDKTPDGAHLGDIVIALRIALQQAESDGHSLLTELQTLILHGVLHCMGHDHETDDGEMHQLERELRRRWLERC